MFKFLKKLNLNQKFLLFPNKRKVRFYCRKIGVDDVEKTEFIPFVDKIEKRRCEAKRSVVIQVQSSQSFNHLHAYCTELGTVERMLHYTVGVEPQHYIIVEFKEKNDVENVLTSCSYVEDNLVVPVRSHFLWFRAAKSKSGKLKINKNLKLDVVNGNRCLKESEIRDCLMQCKNISMQMNELYKMTRLNDVGTRLRFLTALQIENAIRGMFPQAAAYPFGSSVNGFGKMECDLDLVLRLSNKKINDSRLVYHSKAATGSERIMSQRHMEAISDLIYLFLPGCTQVRRILQARIPIIKYHQTLTDVECDLSMSNMSGVYMSDFLYMMGEMDQRVRPLVFAVRKWAKDVGLTNSSPGRWISNFSLTLLVLSFLQKNDILPSLNTFVKLSGANDKFVTEDGIDCTFLRDLNKLKFTPNNSLTSEQLLKDFFAYYAQFDFNTKAVCLNESITIRKPEFSPMYIINPLERGLNVCKNVSLEEVERFKDEAKNAAWALESDESKNENWGLLGIFKAKKAPQTSFAVNKHARLMDVSDLFHGDEEEEKSVVFKNEDVKKQVEVIRKEGKDRVSRLKRQR